MKKKALLGLLLLASVGTTAGCSIVRDLTQIGSSEKEQALTSTSSEKERQTQKKSQKDTKDTGESSEKKTKETSESTVDLQEEAKEKTLFYSRFSALVGSADGVGNSDFLNKELNFVAQIGGDPEQSENGDESLKDQWYVPVYLLRNPRNPIFLNVTNIPKEEWPKSGDVVRIKGKLVGYLYSTYENEKINMLDIDAKAIEKVTIDEASIPATTTIDTELYKITITSTALLYDDFDDPNLVVYYNFDNKQETSERPPVDTYFFFMQGETRLDHSIFIDAEEGLDPKAIHNQYIEPGFELLFYEAFPLETLDMPVSLTVYDDEYTPLTRVEIPIPSAG